MELLLLIIRSLSFYAVPLLIGRACYLVYKKLAKKVGLLNLTGYAHNDLYRWLRIPYYLALGSLVMFLWSLVVEYGLKNLLSVNFFSIFITGMVTLAVGSAVVNLWFFPRNVLGLAKQIFLPALWIGSLSGLVLLIWWHQSPSVLNWDWYQHQRLATSIQRGQYSYWTDEILDTFGFNSYPPFLHLIISTSQWGMDNSPVVLNQFWRVISVLHLLTVGAASWLLGWVVFRSNYLGWLSSTLGILIFDSSVSFTNLFFLPQTVAATLFIFLFCLVIWHINRNESVSFEWLAVGASVLFFMHYVIGGLAFLILLGIGLYSWVRIWWPSVMREALVVPMILLLAIVGVIISQLIPLDELNRGEAAAYIFDIETKLGFIEQSYGYLLYLLFPLGVIAALIGKERVTYLICLFITFGLAMIYVSGFPYIVKYFTLGKFFVHLFMAYGLFWLASMARWPFTKYVLGLVLVPALAFNLVVGSYFWKASLLYQNQYTHLSAYDFQAAEFLQANYDWSNTLLISDPATQFLLEGLSGLDSPGGAYISKATRDQFIAALRAADTNDSLAYLSFINDRVMPRPERRILALSGRTFAWLNADKDKQLAFNFNNWSPLDLAPQEIVFAQDLDTHPRVTKVLENPYIILLEIR